VPAIFHRYPIAACCWRSIAARSTAGTATAGGWWGRPSRPSPARTWPTPSDYIRRTPAIRDVLISGGDPLTLSTDRWRRSSPRAGHPHVEIIRIGSRVPVVLPMRVDDELTAMLTPVPPAVPQHPLQPPQGLTAAARAACERLADAGIPIGNQTVLLRGVNSSARVLRKLFTELLRCRVRPYYLFQGDVAEGTGHLRTSVETGIALMEQLRGHISGLAIPHLVIDTPAAWAR
jgi:lysine 2,3-aminomutase